MTTTKWNHRAKPTALERPAGRIQSPLWGILGSILLVAAILGVLVYFGPHEQILRLLEWFDAQGAWVSLLFILLMAAVVVLVLWSSQVLIRRSTHPGYVTTVPRHGANTHAAS